MDWLRDKQVAVTGRLASMPHSGAAKLIRSLGGNFAASVNRQTDLLVVGSWPLQSDGRLTQKLRRAHEIKRQGATIEICAEDDFLARLELHDRFDKTRRLYNLAQLTRLLKVSRDRIRHWLSAGWIKPVEEKHGVPFFDFQHVLGVKTLWRLTQAGVSPKRIRRSLEQMQTWLSGNDPLSQLALLEENGRLFLRLDEGLADPSGQLQLDFEQPDATVQMQRRNSPDEWFRTGREHEHAEQWDLAVRAYRQALLAGGPNAATAFNLANVYFAWGKNDSAVERYYQVVEMEPNHAKAWNNLGGVLAEIEEFEASVRAYQMAVELDYLDAHFNLAGVLESLGRTGEARPHWQAYVDHDSDSEWGRLAAERLGDNGSQPTALRLA